MGHGNGGPLRKCDSGRTETVQEHGSSSATQNNMPLAQLSFLTTGTLVGRPTEIKKVDSAESTQD